MEDKEGSGIQKYTESPVTSRSISGNDTTSVYLAYIFLATLKNPGVSVLSYSLQIRLKGRSAEAVSKKYKISGTIRTWKTERGGRGKAISRPHWLATSDSILFPH